MAAEARGLTAAGEPRSRATTAVTPETRADCTRDKRQRSRKRRLEREDMGSER